MLDSCDYLTMYPPLLATPESDAAAEGIITVNPVLRIRSGRRRPQFQRMIEHWTAGAAQDYRWFRQSDPRVAQRLDRLLDDITRRPFTGIGTPEP